MTERVRDVSSVLTIGLSTRTIEEFLGMLRSAGVTLLADVRRFPHSPRYPWFGEGSLPEELREQDIGSAHLPGLGGRRRPLPDSPNAGWRNPSFRGYADHMETPEFREGFEGLTGVCRRERVCLMCSEAVWWRCHRRMISDALVISSMGVDAHHGRDAPAVPRACPPGPRLSTRMGTGGSFFLRGTGAVRIAQRSSNSAPE